MYTTKWIYWKVSTFKWSIHSRRSQKRERERVGMKIIVMLDAKSAFDVVVHKKMLRKLYHIGIDDNHWTIIDSMLKPPSNGKDISLRASISRKGTSRWFIECWPIQDRCGPTTTQAEKLWPGCKDWKRRMLCNSMCWWHHHKQQQWSRSPNVSKHGDWLQLKWTI